MKSARTLSSVIVGGALAAAVLFAYYQGLLDTPELKSLDLRFRIRGTAVPRAPIVLVSIDQDSFDELNLPWPWPRTLHATLIRKLANSHAKVIALDILFTEPKADITEDHELAAAINQAGNVVLAAELTEVLSDFGPKTTLNLPIPMLRESALGYGPVNLITDADGIIRRARPGLYFQDKIYPSFTYRIYQAIAVKKTIGTGISAEPYLINFRGPPRTYPVVPYYRILRDEVDPDFFRDKIVLIGSFAPSLHDVFPTPFSADRPMAGVEIQASLLESFLSDDPIVPLAGWAHALVFMGLCAVTIWISLRLAPLKAFAVVFSVAGSYAFSCLYLFAQHRIELPMTPSLLGIVLSYGGLTLSSYVQEQRERIRTRAFLNKYVSADVAEELLQERDGLALGGKRRHITVLFSDLRGFTGISEQLSPEEVVSLLSDYLAQVTRIIWKHGGTVDKFMGDGVMAMFGAPKSHGDDAMRAVQTGLELIELVHSLAPKWREVIGRPLKIGVGINSGDAVVGTIGSEIKSDFTAIGDTVNLASRLEALTKEMEVPILVSEFTAAELGDAVPLIPLQRVKVQGREAPLLVYTAAAYLDGRADSATDAVEPYVQRHK
jgi:adenylate cyclase